MADVYQRVSAVGAAVVQKWQEFSGSTYFVRVMGSVLLNSTGGEIGSTAVPMKVQGLASTEAIGHVTVDAPLPALAASTALIGGLQPSTAVIGHIISDASTAIVGKVEPAITTPTLYAITTTAANTEYSQAMPTNCRKWEFQARTAVDLRLAFATGIVATPTTDPYMTVKAGDYYYSPDIAQAAAPSTLFFGSASTGVTIEILAWT